ncbi:MAG: hypothetical protein HC890_13210 [Chloroflexaceae bacterium]|nr:hypothetical protein [Chloroflexaceae bacterium]
MLSNSTNTALAIAILAGFVPQPSFAASLSSVSSRVIKFSARDSEATLMARGAASVSFGDTTIYIGTTQVSSINQNPIITSFTNGVRDWAVTNYETGGADSRGQGLLWDGGSNLYAVFTTDGTQGQASQDFRRFTTGGWLTSYGAGGGPRASVLLKLDPLNGSGIPGRGTFIRAQTSTGRTNTVVPTGLDFLGDNLVFLGNSFFSPCVPTAGP